MKFDEWWERLDRDDETTDSPRTWAQVGWNAAITHSNEIHELRGKYKDLLSPTDEDPTPTEMVRRLLERGWEAKLDPQDGVIEGFYPLKVAYRKAFPRKVKKEVEVWWCPHCNGVYHCGPKRTTQWAPICNPMKSTATFWVEEE